MKLGMYIVTPEPISTAYFLNPSINLYMCIPPIIARQWLRKFFPYFGRKAAARYTSSSGKEYTQNRRIIGWACLFIPLSFLGNGSVNAFPLQRGIVEGVVFYAVQVVSKESRPLVLLRTCF
jgi:hypothetical protein